MGRLDIVASLPKQLVRLRPTPRNLREGEACGALAADPEPERIATGVLRRNSLWAKASRRIRVCTIELTLPKELGFHGHSVKDSAERGDPTQMELCS
jgi:hypothetical protein